MTGFADMDLGDFLEKLAAPTPTPGGGTASAVAGAMAAALLGMAVSLSLKKRPEEGVLREVAARAAELRRALLKLGGADTAAYEAVMKAYRLPKGTPEEADARRTAIRRALQEAARVPLRTAELALEVLELAVNARDVISEAIVSDLLVAVSLAHAAVKGGLCNVDINCLSLTDGTARAEFATHRKRIETRARELLDQFSRMEEKLASWLGEEDSNLH
ncbi:cyclodeaminase/cyclohydrolase family protein [Candidatus Bipolaricaulota sp. J31]